MSQINDDIENLLLLLKRAILAKYGYRPVRLKVWIEGPEEPMAWPFPRSGDVPQTATPPVVPPPEVDGEPEPAPRETTPRVEQPGEDSSFEPNDTQLKILQALEFQALKPTPLGEAIGERRDLYRKSARSGLTNIEELRRHGLVKISKEHGFYRPDMPPEELLDPGEDE